MYASQKRKNLPESPYVSKKAREGSSWSDDDFEVNDLEKNVFLSNYPTDDLLSYLDALTEDKVANSSDDDSKVEKPYKAEEPEVIDLQETVYSLSSDDDEGGHNEDGLSSPIPVKENADKMSKTVPYQDSDEADRERSKILNDSFDSEDLNEIDLLTQDLCAESIPREFPKPSNHFAFTQALNETGNTEELQNLTLHSSDEEFLDDATETVTHTQMGRYLKPNSPEISCTQFFSKKKSIQGYNPLIDSSSDEDADLDESELDSFIDNGTILETSDTSLTPRAVTQGPLRTRRQRARESFQTPKKPKFIKPKRVVKFCSDSD